MQPSLLLLLACLFLGGVTLQPGENGGSTAENLATAGYQKPEVWVKGTTLIRPSDTANAGSWSSDGQTTHIHPALIAIQRSPSSVSLKSPTFREVPSLRLGGIQVRAFSAYSGVQSAPTPRSSSADKQSAMLLLKAGKFREAVRRLQALKQSNPSDISVQVALVDAYFKAGMRSDGERETQKVLASPALSETAGLELAKVLIEDKQPQTALKACEALTIKYPESAEAHAETGLLLSAKSQFEQAAWELGRAVQLKPDSAGYVQALAELLLSWRHYSTALDFVTAEELRFGKLPDLEYCRAFALYGLRRHEEALAALDKLLEQYPRFDRAYYLSGTCYVNLGDSEKAAARFKKAIELSPNNPSYYIALAEVSRRDSTKADEAIAYARMGLRLDPTSSDGKIQLALCYETKKEYTRARVLLEGVTQAHPELITPHRILARIYHQQGDTSDADRQTQIAARLEAQHLKHE